MSDSPNFISLPRLERAVLTTANTNIDGTGVITPLITGAAVNASITGSTGGTRVLEIATQCAATSSAANVNIFLSLDGGTTWDLYDQISITAATSSNTVKANRNFTTYTNLVLPNANARLGVTTTISQATRVYAHAGDL